MPPWVADYVGLPWKPLGRSRDGLDCYGLVRLVLAECFGLVLPLLQNCGWNGARSPDALQDLAETVAVNLHDGWMPVQRSEARLGDLVLLRLHGRPIHLGIVVGENWFLHVRDGTDSALDRFDSLIWCTRVAGLYRHERMP